MSLILDGLKTEVYEAADSDSSSVSIRAVHDIKSVFSSPSFIWQHQEIKPAIYVSLLEAKVIPS